MRSSLLLSSFLLGAEATIYYAGVSESGGEFGVYGTPGTGLPGTFGVDYQFINSSAVDVYVDQNKVGHSSTHLSQTMPSTNDETAANSQSDQLVPSCFPAGANVPIGIRSRSQVQRDCKSNPYCALFRSTDTPRRISISTNHTKTSTLTSTSKP